MAKTTKATLYLGTDLQYEFQILNEAETEAIDITTWALSWMVKKRLSDADDDALLEKTTGSGIAIAGVYDSTPEDNLQRATVTIADTDTDELPAGLWRYELKRTGSGVETILANGQIEFIRTVHRA